MYSLASRPPSSPGTNPKTVDAGVRRPSSPDPPNSPRLQPGSPRTGETQRWRGRVPSRRPSCGARRALPAGNVAQIGRAHV